MIDDQCEVQCDAAPSLPAAVAGFGSLSHFFFSRTKNNKKKIRLPTKIPRTGVTLEKIFLLYFCFLSLFAMLMCIVTTNTSKIKTCFFLKMILFLNIKQETNTVFFKVHA